MKNKSFLGLLLFSCICLTAIAQETTKPIKGSKYLIIKWLN